MLYDEEKSNKLYVNAESLIKSGHLEECDRNNILIINRTVGRLNLANSVNCMRSNYKLIIGGIALLIEIMFKYIPRLIPYRIWFSGLSSVVSDIFDIFSTQINDIILENIISKSRIIETPTAKHTFVSGVVYKLTNFFMSKVINMLFPDKKNREDIKAIFNTVVKSLNLNTTSSVQYNEKQPEDNIIDINNPSEVIDKLTSILGIASGLFGDKIKTI